MLVVAECEANPSALAIQQLVDTREEHHFLILKMIGGVPYTPPEEPP